MGWIFAFLFAVQLIAADRHVILVSIDGFASYSLNDPKSAIPNLRRLAREGAAASGLQVVNPAVTWPNHTSMVTGVTPARHGVLYNGLAVRENNRIRIEPWRPKTELVRAPTIYDLAHKAGMTTAQVDWVAIFQAPTITWAFSELGDPQGAIEREMVSAGLISADDVAAFSKAPITWRDEIWTKAAIHILEKHRPNLLLLHLLATYTVQHRYGPKNLAAASALALADARLGELLAAIDRAGLRDSTTVVVVSDHGFKTVEKAIRPNIDGAQVVPEGGTGMVYVTAGDKDRIKNELAQLEGVDRVIEAAEFAKYGLPLPEKHEGMADFVAAAKEGYAFAGGVGANVEKYVSAQGAHGYLNTDPEMNGIFVAWGAGIRKASVPSVRTIDIAPTIAKLLGLKLEGVDGRALTEILK
jgi:predicted AlkP superfamily pyrophosphatase or phosphodiesterase